MALSLRIVAPSSLAMAASTRRSISERRAGSTAALPFDCGDVDLCHFHHRSERSLGGSSVGVGDRFEQGDRRNLPGHAPLVLAPAARALFAAVADDRVPVTIGFGLDYGRDLKRKCFALLECGSPIESESGNAHHCKFDRQHIAFFPGLKVSRREVHNANKKNEENTRIK